MKRLMKKSFLKQAGWIRLDSERKDEGPPGYEAGPSTLTCRQVGVVDIQDVINLPGMNRENRQWTTWTDPNTGEEIEYFGNYRKDRWEAFLEDIKANGIKYPIFINVEKDGTTHVNEGNHRIQAAIQLGLTEVPVEVAYFGNSQREFSFPS